MCATKVIVTIICSVVAYTLYAQPTSTIFITDNRGYTYRTFNNDKLIVLNPHESIILYKATIKSSIKELPHKYNYFFSKDSSSNIIPLSIITIENEFANNKVFQFFIELYFKKDAELLEYDAIHHQYKLNRLLQLAKEIKTNNEQTTK